MPYAKSSMTSLTLWSACSEAYCIQLLILVIDKRAIFPCQFGSSVLFVLISCAFCFQDGRMQKLEKAKITLNDCLACSGCITSAESILITQQSHEELYRILRLNKVL